MTTCATETATETETVRRAGFTLAADGSYAACLAARGESDDWYPERWTLDGPEPYTVPLPGNQPEDPGSEVLPLLDGRVLIRRRVADRHDLVLLYPTGPDTGELPLASLGGDGEEVRLLPPPATGDLLALSYDGRTSVIWLVDGGEGEGLRKLAEVPGRCGGGAWLDRTGRLLALDREEDSGGGPVKAVAVDLHHGETSPLLQITEDSNDRLLLAEPDSGLLVVRSDAPGEERLGWGVLGSRRPVRFPEALRPAGAASAVITPFAAQPGQILMPEKCGVALRVDGARGTSLAVWRPDERHAVWLTVPDGWLPGAGLWTVDGVLRLPCACVHCVCGIVEYEVPAAREAERVRRAVPAAMPADRAAPGGAAVPVDVPPVDLPPLTGAGAAALRMRLPESAGGRPVWVRVRVPDAVPVPIPVPEPEPVWVPGPEVYTDAAGHGQPHSPVVPLQKAPLATAGPVTAGS